MAKELNITQPIHLYKHALESIFIFLSLSDLSQALTVSHAWSAAVDSMQSIDATVPKLNCPLVQLCASKLAKHIGCLGPRVEFNDASDLVPVTYDALDLISLRMRNLHTLSFKLPSLTDASLLRLSFPPSLTWIQTEVLTDASDADTNVFISAISCIPKIRRVQLNLDQVRPDISLAPFIACSNLQELSIYRITASYSPTQIDEIRGMIHLTQIFGTVKAADLRHLLRVPHQLKWTVLNCMEHLDIELQGLLYSVPTITEVFVQEGMDVTFLHALPNLCTLRLMDFAPQEPMTSPEQMIQGVGQCVNLTELQIWFCDINADHMCAILSCMPSLTKLGLVGLDELDSLRFLSSSASLSSTLTHFSLRSCHIRAIECHHIFALLELTHLSIVNSLLEQLDSVTKLELTSSKRLRKLISGKV